MEIRTALPSLVQDLLLVALPAGGQKAARRNAWSAMSADASRARGRREAEAALALAELRSSRDRRTGS
jgi:hypothetical protein